MVPEVISRFATVTLIVRAADPGTLIESVRSPTGTPGIQ